MERCTERINPHILLTKQKDTQQDIIVTVYYDYVAVAKFNRNKPAEIKLAAVELIERNICNRTTAARICELHRNTIHALITLKNTLGIEALLEERRGLKQPLKYTADVRITIEQLLAQHPDKSDAHIATLACEQLGMNIHRNGVARIRVLRHSAVQASHHDIMFSRHRREHLMELSKQAEIIDRGTHDHRQLELNFAADDQFKQKKEALEKLPALESDNTSDQRLIERLQQGERSPFAGSLMQHLFLNEINYETLIDGLPLIPPIGGTTYRHIDILTTLYFSIAIGLKSIESLKLINPGDFGCLLGMDRCPDKDVLRAKLTQLADSKPADMLIDRFAHLLLEKQRIDTEVFFIDGHFLPYYGLAVIAKGYYTVRRLAMKGNELYVVSDLNGRPLFSITESNEIDFRPIISLAADKLIGLGIKRPLLTFDRGGYGIHFFSELDEKADFVTWAKYLSAKKLMTIGDDDFTACIVVNHKKYQVAEQLQTVSESIQTAQNDGRIQPVAMQLRLVVIEQLDTGKRIGIYTNNRSKPASFIAWYMLNRWGDSENVYKELMAKFNLNYHPGYDIDELENQPLVDNPDIALTKQAVQVLANDITHLTTLQEDIQQRLTRRHDKRLTRKLNAVIKERDDKMVEKNNFVQRLKTLPDKISIVALLKGKKMSRCDLEKKKLYDLMQFMVMHSYDRLEDLFTSCYHDKRDIKPVLRMITRQAGYVKLIGDTLIVLLDRIDRTKYRGPAENLCHQLNRMNIVLHGHLNMKLYFYISKF